MTAPTTPATIPTRSAPRLDLVAAFYAADTAFEDAREYAGEHDLADLRQARADAAAALIRAAIARHEYGHVVHVDVAMGADGWQVEPTLTWADEPLQCKVTGPDSYCEHDPDDHDLRDECTAYRYACGVIDVPTGPALLRLLVESITTRP